ncbi:MAG: DUF2254 domain-containing protein [Nitrococcus mobilis]|nr:DUF2254 domain-containing protein [Nitrococcus mobilis]
MTKLYTIVLSAYIRATNSIAFLPTIITLSFFFFSLAILFLDKLEFSALIKQAIPSIIAHNTDSARSILGTLTSGIISLTVFSFSMVMIVINQASSSFSPRVIPGLLSKKSHQLVLGFYIGTIVYTMVLLGSLGNSHDHSTLLGIAVLFSILFAIMCLVLFIYFIHSISKAIQVDNITKNIFSVTLRQLERNSSTDSHPAHSIPDTSKWFILAGVSEGYLQNINYSSLVKLAQDDDMVIDILSPKGTFLLKNFPLCRTNKDLSGNAVIKKALLGCFITYPGEYLEENYTYGFKQISEIAVKALSPGINDPGTALHAIDLLNILYLAQMEMRENRYLFDGHGQLRIIKSLLSFDELLYRHLSPIRIYGKADAIVVIRLLECLNKLLYADIHGEHTACLITHLKIIIDDARKTITNDFDREKINRTIEEINRSINDSESLYYLS